VEVPLKQSVRDAEVEERIYWYETSAVGTDYVQVWVVGVGVFATSGSAWSASAVAVVTGVISVEVLQVKLGRSLAKPPAAQSQNTLTQESGEQLV